MELDQASENAFYSTRKSSVKIMATLLIGIGVLAVGIATYGARKDPGGLGIIWSTFIVCTAIVLCCAKFMLCCTKPRPSSQLFPTPVNSDEEKGTKEEKESLTIPQKALI